MREMSEFRSRQCVADRACNTSSRNRELSADAGDARRDSARSMIEARAIGRMVLAVLVIALAAPVQANTVCNNGVCVSCDGPLTCINSACTCNGVPVGGGSAVQPGRCSGEATLAHPNGGGAVSTTASVAASVFVSQDSTVCGRARVTGASRLLAGSLVSGASLVSDSTLEHSIVNGSARVTQSRLTNSTLNGAAAVSQSDIVNSIVNGRASVIGRTLRNSIINN